MKTLILALALLLAVPASAQVAGPSPFAFSVGPQVSTLGFGVGATARFSRLLGVSAEYNLVPLKPLDRHGFDNELTVDPSLGGGLLLVTFHPTGGKFTLGGGIQAGGANADVMLALASGTTVALGDGVYAAEDVGTLNGALDYGSAVQPTFLLGWIGRGFNFAVGAALATPKLEITATGALNDDATFRADLQKEIDSFDQMAGRVPVYPYLRLGWQFKL